MRISSLEIQGFRAYGKIAKVNLPSQLVVIFGRNGRGKSSLIDAVSWAFNGELKRYKAYGNEWRRFHKTHTRNFLLPDVPSVVRLSFASHDGKSTATVERNEQGVSFFGIVEPELQKWFKDHEGDRLWAHLLAQDDLQTIARAKGRDRFEVLAPKLDLSKSQNEINSIEMKIKNLDKTRRELLAQSKSIRVGDETQYQEMLYQSQLNVIHNAKLAGFQLDIANPLDNLQAWREWVKEAGKTLTELISNLVSDEGNILAKYPDLQVVTEIYDEQYVDTVRRRYDLVIADVKDIENVLAINQGELAQIRADIHYSSQLKDMIDRGNYKLAEAKYSLEKLTPFAAEITNELEIRIEEFSQRVHQLRTTLATLESEKILTTKLFEELRDTEATIRHLRRDSLETEEWLAQNSPTKIDTLLDLENRLEKLVGFNEKQMDIQKKLDSSRTYLRSQVHDKNCVLCGSFFSSHEELLSAIDSTSQLWFNKYNELSSEISKLSTTIRELRETNEEYQKRQFKLQGTNEQLKKQHKILDGVLHRMRALTAWQSVHEDLVLKTEWSTLEQHLLNELQNHINLISRRIDDVEGQLIDLFQDNQSKMDKRGEYERQQLYLKNELNEMNKQMEQHYRSLKELASKYIDQEPYDSNEILRNLKSRLSVLELSNSNILADLQIREKQRLELEYEWAQIVWWRKNKLQTCVSDITKLSQVISALEQLRSALDEKKRLEDEVHKIKKELRNLKNKLKEARDNQAMLIKQAVGGLSTRIEKVFEFLNLQSPWKTVKTDVVMPGEKGSANLIFRPVGSMYHSQEYIETVKETANATFLFSSGQFSVLGLSIFLAQSTIAKNRKINGGECLNTLLLDDPIQALDSVRDDALAHLLCEISRERQVIVATSDLNFANRLVLANRPVWEEHLGTSGVIHIENDISGFPRLRVIEPEKWIDDQGIFVPQAKKIITAQ